MKKCLVTLLLTFVVIGCTAPLAVAAPPPQGGQSLYTLLGGYDALVAVTKGFHWPAGDRSFAREVLHRAERHLEGESGVARD